MSTVAQHTVITVKSLFGNYHDEYICTMMHNSVCNYRATNVGELINHIISEHNINPTRLLNTITDYYGTYKDGIDAHDAAGTIRSLKGDS